MGMSRNFLRSDMSEQEGHLFTTGKLVIGEENTITNFFKLAGKFDELQEVGRSQEITEYHPELDRRFHFENRGYTTIRTILKEKYKDSHFALSRRHLIKLSRKWAGSRIVLSFKSGLILTELLTYLRSDPNLNTAFEAYLSKIDTRWPQLMPIQYEFLSVRHVDQHKDFRIAGTIINELNSLIL